LLEKVTLVLSVLLCSLEQQHFLRGGINWPETTAMKMRGSPAAAAGKHL
jgi:hypothetical protein